MAVLNSDDMRHVLAMLPKDIIDLMRKCPILLAGGYLRARIAGETVNDIDLTADTSEACKAYAHVLATDRKGELFRTKNAWTVLSPPRSPVQFIHRWTFTDPDELIASFDFTISKAAVWFDRTAMAWKSVVASTFYEDLAARRLVYTFPQRNEDAGGSLLRVQKFLSRGYHISPEEFAKVISRFLGGVHDSNLWSSDEVGRAAVLAGLLRQADPLTVIDGLRPSDDSLDEAPTPEPIFS